MGVRHSSPALQMPERMQRLTCRPWWRLGSVRFRATRRCTHNALCWVAECSLEAFGIFPQCCRRKSEHFSESSHASLHISNI